MPPLAHVPMEAVERNGFWKDKAVWETTLLQLKLQSTLQNHHVWIDNGRWWC